METETRQMLNGLSSEFYEIRNKLDSLRQIEENDQYHLMSIEIAKQTDSLIDQLIGVTKQLIELKS